jgi:hypothetical protein
VLADLAESRHQKAEPRRVDVGQFFQSSSR